MPDTDNTERFSSRRLPLQLFSLRNGMASQDEIDESIRSNVGAMGGNLWVLFFAILIASLGLNLNSTAVIIGAMLISPLMGPIVGAGYGLAIHNFDLVGRSVRNFLIFASISLVTSTLYFIVSPLADPGSEILSRTSPTLWDVLIAFFGGAAGIIALTRKRFSNVVPGVAIATALMPPLCTAGYSLAHGHWIWFGGALYLFAINSVFIAYATLLFSRILHLHYIPFEQENESTKKRASKIAALILVVMAAPSIYFGWEVVDAQRYTNAVNAAVQNEAVNNNFVVISRSINAKARQVHLTIAGDADPAVLSQQLTNRLVDNHNPRWSKTEFNVQSINSVSTDAKAIRQQFKEDLLRASQSQTEALNQQISILNQQSEKKTQQQLHNNLLKLEKELLAQYPQFHGLKIGLAFPETEGRTKPTAPAAKTSETASQASTEPPKYVVLLQLPASAAQLTPAEYTRLANWLRIRLAPHDFSLAFLSQK